MWIEANDLFGQHRKLLMYSRSRTSTCVSQHRTGTFPKQDEVSLNVNRSRSCPDIRRLTTARYCIANAAQSSLPVFLKNQTNLSATLCNPEVLEGAHRSTAGGFSRG